MSHPVKVVKVCGILGHTQAKQFKQDIFDVIAAGTVQILVDFEQATFMDSSGLGALVSSLKVVKAAQGTLALCSLGQEIRMLLELADVIQFFPIFANQLEFDRAREGCSMV
ncbi:STAS domain-containing protein [Leptolyngbya sp. NIES-2104]|uniref:STAS domain-containing protein n=1 Tax=Leptolyngbya sp. NIES-2104 TaxID=1552121 RepID=UPI0006ECA26C|nr:STAS domain-containing protein [Leptolyngbya sp. NIES-2104]GAP95175.1 anti-sigma F factor antagonist [Leptolyngbya sp. NIES-2104]